MTWFDGAFQVNEIYERQAPAMFVPNVFSFATEGKLFRYGAIRMPIEMWGPWRDEENQAEGQLHHVRASVASMLRPEVVLDILQNFTLFATDKKHRRIKIICRYQQYFTTNQIVERVVKGYPKKGLIWHFQGSGKSLLMVFAAQKLRMHPRLGNPTVIIVVDRIDLDTQITATFNAADVPNMVGVATRQELQALLGQDVRKVLITTIHKFAEAGGRLNERSNIIVMVDEAHRTQEGDLGRKMREALPNAFLFGLTGTPINRADKNTFWAFGADEDEKGYLSRYSFQESIRDKATLPLHFEAPEVKLKIDKAAIDEAYAQITGNLSEQDRDDLAKRAAKMAVLVKNPERIRAVVNHIVRHFRTKVEPNGFKAQVVVFDRECCVLYKAVMDELIDPEASAIVMTGAQGDPPEWKAHVRDKDAEEKLLDRFRDPDRSAPVRHRDEQAPHRLRRPHPPGDVPRQADEGPQPPPGDLPDQPDLRPGEDPRPDRGLHRHLRRRGPGARLRREGRPAGRLEHRRAAQGPARADAEVPRLLSRRGPGRRRLRGAHGRAAVPAQQRSAGPVRRELHRPGNDLGGPLARSVPESLRERLQVADQGLRVREAAQRQRQAPLARPGGEDGRADQRERPRRVGARRRRDAGDGCPGAGGDPEGRRARARRRGRSRSGSSPACAGTWGTPSSPPWANGWRRSGSATSRASSPAWSF